ncbi:Lipoprotein LpqJ [Mycobacterium sp. smrl_JER01]
MAGMALTGALALVGCQSLTEGTATRPPDSFAEPEFPTPRPSRPTSAPPSTPQPAPSTPSRPPGGEVLQPQNGYVFIQTKTGKTRCQLDKQEVGCESAFTNAPEIDGLPANGVRLSADGNLSWVLGNLGAIPAVTLDYRTYSAVGWTIDADVNGTRFTNDGTGHGMVISVEGVESF